MNNGKWRFSTYYGLGAAMGFGPEQVGRMSPWHFMACVEGFGRANGWKAETRGKPMSDARMRELGIEGI